MHFNFHRINILLISHICRFCVFKFAEAAGQSGVNFHSKIFADKHLRIAKPFSVVYLPIFTF